MLEWPVKDRVDPDPHAETAGRDQTRSQTARLLSPRIYAAVCTLLSALRSNLFVSLLYRPSKGQNQSPGVLRLGRFTGWRP